MKQNNPQAIIIAHEKTLQRMGKGNVSIICLLSRPSVASLNTYALLFMSKCIFPDRAMLTPDYGLDCIAVSGGSKLLISGQELEIVSAPVCSSMTLFFAAMSKLSELTV